MIDRRARKQRHRQRRAAWRLRREQTFEDMLETAENVFFTRLAAEYRKSGFRPSTRPLPSERPTRSEMPPIRQFTPREGHSWRPEDWRHFLELRDDGKPGFWPSVANVLAMLRHHPSLCGLIAHDGEKAIMKAKAPYDPWEPEFEMRPVRRDDITAIHAFIETEALGHIDRETVIAAVLRVARENPLEGEW